jgi:hypothetical protein
MMAAGIPSEVVRLLRCPHYGERLKATDRSLRCASGHSHDIARQGYVSLFPSGRRTPSGDPPQMVDPVRGSSPPVTTLCSRRPLAARAWGRFACQRSRRISWALVTASARLAAPSLR